MFFNYESLVKIHATPGQSVSHATHRPQDLIPAFLEVIRDTPEYVQIVTAPLSPLNVATCQLADGDDLHPYWDSESCSDFLNEELFDLLDSFAPENMYFGAHMGDGSDYAYWADEGYELITVTILPSEYFVHALPELSYTRIIALRKDRGIIDVREAKEEILSELFTVSIKPIQ